MKSIVGIFLPIQKSTRSLDYIYVNTVSNTSKLRRSWIDIVRSVQCTVLRVGCTFHFSMYRSTFSARKTRREATSSGSFPKTKTHKRVTISLVFVVCPFCSDPALAAS